MEDDQPRARFVIHLKQIEFFAQTPVISLFGLFQERQIILKRLLIGKARAVDALEHLISLIAAPVGARHAQQLEGFDHAGPRNVRAAA